MAEPAIHTRRSFLARSLAAGAGLTAPSLVLGAASGLLAACGSDPVAPTIVPLFSNDHVIVAGRSQRIPIAVVSPDPGVDTDAAVPNDDTELNVVVTIDGEEIDRAAVAGHIVDHDHVGEPDPDHQHANLFRYYPLRTTLPRVGVYDLAISFDGTETMLPIQAFDPADVSVPLVGDRFPSITTPTFDRPGSVDRLCTRVDPCPFHTTSADTIVDAGGRPMALLVATPAFCSTAYCGPVLETLIDAAPAHPEVDIVHLEVYANPDEVDGNFTDPRIRLIPAVTQLGLGFEPSLFLVAGDGTLVDRIDNVFDRTELDAALAALA